MLNKPVAAAGEATLDKSRPDGGEAMLEGLRGLGIDYIFTSPGSEWGGFWEAIARQKVYGTPGPEFVSCWHETLAMDLALGYTLVTGRMQAVVLHAGVGLLQGGMGIQSAQIQNLPVLVFSGESLTYGEREGFDPGSQWYQNLSVVGGVSRIVEPFCKWSGQVPSVETLYNTVVRGGQIAQRTPMGPVYISVPIETQLQPWAKPARLARSKPAVPPRAPVPEIERVAELLLKAKNPVITTEAAGRDAAGYNALLELAEELAIPVIETTSTLFSNFHKGHPLHQGPSFAPFFETTDLALVIRSRAPWYPPHKRPPNAEIVLIDENPFRHHMAYQNLHADSVLEGDVTFTLQTLAAAVKGKGGPEVEERRKRHAASHAKADEARNIFLAAASKKPKIDPGLLSAMLSDTLPANTVYVDESVTHRIPIEAHLRPKGAGSFLKVRGGLGQGIGHGLGAKIALPDQPVVVLVGDGTFLYNPITQCLGFAEQMKLGIIIVVYNNNRYLAMKLDHARYYPDGVSKDKNIYVGEVIGSNPAIERLGEPFGCWGRKVEHPDDLQAAIREAHAATLLGRTAILNVMVDP